MGVDVDGIAERERLTITGVEPAEAGNPEALKWSSLLKTQYELECLSKDLSREVKDFDGITPEEWKTLRDKVIPKLKKEAIPF